MTQNKHVRPGGSSGIAEMIVSARECIQHNDLIGALELYETASRLQPESLPSQQSAARILLTLGRVEESEARFRTLIASFPDSVGLRVGLAQTLRKRRSFSEALDVYNAVLRIDPQFSAAQLGRAETLIELGRSAEAESHLQALTTIAPKLPGVWMGLARIYQRRGDFSGALKLLNDSLIHMREHPRINGMIGRMQLLLGRYDEAEATFRRQLDRDPSELECLRGMADIAVRQRNLPYALGWLGSAERAAPGALVIKRRIHEILCQLKRFEAAEEIVERIRKLRPDSSDFYLAAGRLEYYRGRYQVALEHLSNAVVRAPDDIGIRFHIVDTFVALSQGADADAELARIAQLIGIDNSRLQAKSLECLCCTLRFDEALTYASRWTNYSDVPDEAVGTLIGLFATLERWRDVFLIFRECIVRNRWTGNFATIGQVLLQAARATKQYSEALLILQQLNDGVVDVDIAACISQIKAELDLIEQLNASFEPASESSPSLPERHEPPASIGSLLQSVTACELPSVEVFTCTDGNYLPAAAVCIFSLLRTNLQNVRRYRISVYCADEAMAAATGSFSAIGTAFGTRINVVRASNSIAPVGAQLRTSYGFFTRGKAMPVSAYLRIYAARHLRKTTRAKRMIYLDADTCIQAGFNRFIDFDLRDHPLGARLDDTSEAGIRRAASLLRIDPERYFNSGVLLFDLSHSGLPGLLDRTVEIVEHEQDKLTFQDQCALNLAFCGHFAMLPDPFNHFVKPGVTELVGDAEPIVIHFGGHPKPWDPVSKDPKKTRWLEECAALAQITGPQSLREMLALGFGITLASRHSRPSGTPLASNMSGDYTGAETTG